MNAPMAKSPKTTTAPTGQLSPFGLRMLPELKEQIEAAAKASGRSMNAEIVTRLQGGVDVMTLRDHFAGLALQALIGRMDDELQEKFCQIADEKGIEPKEAIARSALGYADAMLKARDA